MCYLGPVELAPSLYRRPLPEPLIPFSSDAGRELFRRALADGTLETFFPLIEQFHTQADPAFCGLGSLVMALNALAVDPGRVWRGPWRWFSEELLDCCTPLSRVQLTGLSLEEVACLGRCNGADVELSRPDRGGIDEFRAAVSAATRSTRQVLIASYCRSALGQTGAGHFSPIGGYHADRDLVLVLDVARFKYPPHWVPLGAFFAAMQSTDPITSRSRGWLTLQKRQSAAAIAQFLVCADGHGTKGTLERLISAQAERCREILPTTLEALLELSAEALGASGLMDRVRFRAPQTPEHEAVFTELRALVRQLPLYDRAGQHLGPELAAPIVLWWLAAPSAAFGELPASLERELGELVDLSRVPARLAAELTLLRSQVEFLLEYSPAAAGHRGSSATASSFCGVPEREGRERVDLSLGVAAPTVDEPPRIGGIE